jgi:hypothetical protein
MTSGRKAAGWRSKSVSKVRRPREEQLAHLRFIERRRISRGVTPSRCAQAWTSALNRSNGLFRLYALGAQPPLDGEGLRRERTGAALLLGGLQLTHDRVQVTQRILG